MSDFMDRVKQSNTDGLLHEETLIERLPMELNLGQPEVIIGWASASRNSKTRKITLTIELDEYASDKLANLTEVFELKAIGFAGIKRSPRANGG